MWQGLSEAEQRRFLRHLRPWWDVHRHRIAPRVAARIEALRGSGRLEVVGRADRPGSTAGRVTIARRGGGELRRSFAAVINCTGPEGISARIEDPLIRGLLASGRARPDRLGLGFDVDREFAGASGSGPSPALYALGPLTKGAFWEIVAVPDIRGQAAGVAQARSPRLSILRSGWDGAVAGLPGRSRGLGGGAGERVGDRRRRGRARAARRGRSGLPTSDGSIFDRRPLDRGEAGERDREDDEQVARTEVARVRKSAAPRADISPDGLPPTPSPPPSERCIRITATIEAATSDWRSGGR